MALLVSAGEFIAVAEQLGLSRLIDRRTLELADRVLKSHPSSACRSTYRA